MAQVNEINSGTPIHVFCSAQLIPTMPADALATLGATVSASMLLTYQSWNIPPPASEAFDDVQTDKNHSFQIFRIHIA